MSGTYPTTRADLLARIAVGRAELDDFVAGLRDEQLAAPGPGGDWSIKDHLYHLGAWERKVMAQMHGAAIPAALGITQAIWESDEIDTINAAIAAQGRDLAVDEVLASYRRAHADLLAALEVYPEADYRLLGYPDDAESGPMVGYIAGNTYEHHAEHLIYIKRLALTANLPGDKAALLARIAASRAALEEVIAPLSMERLAAPGPDGGWSVKDHLYHLATWQRVQIARMQGSPPWAVVELDEAGFHAACDPATDYHEINAIIARRGAAWSAAAVLAHFRDTQAELLVELDRWTYDALLRPLRPDGLTTLKQLSGDSYEHDDEHLRMIRALV